MVDRFSVYGFDGHLISRGGISFWCQLGCRVEESSVSRVHEQPIVAQKVYADDRRLDVSYHETALEGPT